MAFIDYEKAFYSVRIPTVLEVEEVFGKIFEDLHKDGTATIKLNTETDKMPLKKGDRQGNTTPPKLFTACLEEIFKKLEWNGKGIKTGDEHSLNSLRFTGDIIFFSESSNELQPLINDRNRESLKFGLKINRKKAMVMFNSRVQFEKIHVQGEALEDVEE